jgi:cytochrome c oxidase subunit 2
MTPRSRWTPLLILGLCLASAALFASPAMAWLLHPATSIARDVRVLFYKAVAITAFFFILAEGILLVAVLKFRAKPGVPPAKWHENVRLEIVWTVIPALAMVVLSGPAFTTEKSMDAIPKSDVQIEVVGHQWFWEYRYPQQGIIFANEPLVLPAGKIISANITSIDVVHSWFVPDFGIKMDANPGRINHVWFNVDKPGTYKGQCAELCGVLHAQMFITVNVVTPEEFARWIEQKKKGA